MSTAEQVIAAHRLKYKRTPARHLADTGVAYAACAAPDCDWSYDYATAGAEVAHAAHVVAALTNAGKTIVDSAGIYVKYGIERDVPSGGTRVVAAYDRSTAEGVMAERPHDTRLVQRRGHIGEWEPAAARVAEGGERGE